MDLFKGFDDGLVGVDGIRLDPGRLRTLENLLIRKFGATVRVTIIRRFKSKKNVVLQLRIQRKGEIHLINLVAKMFVVDRFDNELQTLRACYEGGLAVPEVIAADEGVILMSYITGEPLVEIVNRTFEPRLIEGLAEWYYKYHLLSGLIKGDPRLRNFIYRDGVIFGLDFEETQTGHWILDIGGIAASLLDTMPVFDKRKRVLAWRLLEHYLALRGEARSEDVDRMFVQAVSNALKETAHWRRDENLLRFAERVSQLGIPVD